MPMRYHSFIRLLGIILLTVTCAYALCDERITDFHSDIQVKTDASMQVRETITVIAMFDKIKHGIYRDFPIVYRDRQGHRYTIGFTVRDVQRDGHQEPYRLQKQVNGVRIYIGNPENLVEEGAHTYSITYTTDRQLGFFADHDELYWNVTGNGWDFPIDHASATVSLPSGIGAREIGVSGFTGPSGSRARNLKALVDKNNQAQFATTKPLEVHDGLTIVVTFPKGHIQPPTSQARIQTWFSDNRTWFSALACLLLLGMYYYPSWRLVGRDPQSGTIIPLFTPPQGLSPAAIRYIRRMGDFDEKTFTAAVLNLAVKGYVTIKEFDTSYTLTRVEKSLDALQRQAKTPPTPDELTLFNTLLVEPSIELTPTEYALFQSAQCQTENVLKSTWGTGEYFAKNALFTWVGILFTLLLAIAVIAISMQLDSVEPFVSGRFSGDSITGYIAGSIFALSGAGMSVYTAMLVYRRSLRSSLASMFVTGGCGNAFTGIFLALFCLLVTLVGFYFLFQVSVSFLIFFVGALLLNAIFCPLLRAYTVSGRKMVDEIEGFRLFLTVTSPEQFPTPPSAELFEAYLPYAVALDVEEQWSERFTQVLAQTGHTARSYHPGWYTGAMWGDIGGTAAFAGVLSNTLTSAISSSSTAPGSSSGSGGSSGGGGGGGGGGGW
ncbi:MAG TPA: DUF2207 domain-containing protein [Armatimonadota bacterium]|nr:DUF2207 domain-containing protein [Armatimonadota bacterium]